MKGKSDWPRIIQELTIESAIGDQNVLNNVGKIEKFIVQQLKKFLKDYAVFPNYHSILLEPDQESPMP